MLTSNRRPAGLPSFCKSGGSSTLLNDLSILLSPVFTSPLCKTAILPFSLTLPMAHKSLPSGIQQGTDMFDEQTKMRKLYHAGTSELYLTKVKLQPGFECLHSSMQCVKFLFCFRIVVHQHLDCISSHFSPGSCMHGALLVTTRRYSRLVQCMKWH